MTDNEIIKALECCTNCICHHSKTDTKCPLTEMQFCKHYLMSECIAIINRQKAELNQYAQDQHELMIEKDKLFDIAEKQKAELERHEKVAEEILVEVQEVKKIYVKDIANARAEAITEFAERLKGRLEFWDCGYCGDSMADEIRQYTFDIIDQIAKEMKEENEWGMQKLQQPQGDNEVKCKECEYLMFSDCYGECRKAYKGIVNPNDSCGKGKKRVKGEQ